MMTATRLTLDAAHRDAGASFAEDLGHEIPSSYSDPLREQEFVHRAAGLMDVSYRGLIDVRGKDPAGFLDGILTSAVRKLQPSRGQLSCLLSPKGRVLAAFRLYAIEDGSFRMALSEPTRDAVLSAIGKYAALSDATVVRRDEELAVLSVQGPASGRALAPLLTGGKLPDEPFLARTVTLRGLEVSIARDGETPEGGFDLWVPRASLPAAWSAILEAVTAAGGGPVGHDAAEALRVEAGAARYGKDCDEECFPAEIGWEGALTFHKCYVGQEVVARMRTYGHANRCLKGVLAAADSLLPAGAALRVGGETVGTVTSPGLSARLGLRCALAMVHRKAWDAATGEVEIPGGSTPVTIAGLPLVHL